MEQEQQQQSEQAVQGGYILREIFEDFYEHRVYFNLINAMDTSDFYPSDIEIELSRKVKTPRLKFPVESPELVRIIIPISSSQHNLQKKVELIAQNLHKYASLVPKIKLSLKNQLAALRKELTNEQEAALISQKVEQMRQAGLKETKALLAGSRKPKS